MTCKLSAWDASASGSEKKLLQRCPMDCPLWHRSRVGHMQACRLMSCALSVVSELSALQTFLFYLVKLWHPFSDSISVRHDDALAKDKHLYDMQVSHHTNTHRHTLTWGILSIYWLAVCSTNIVARSSVRHSFSPGLDEPYATIADLWVFMASYGASSCDTRDEPLLALSQSLPATTGKGGHRLKTHLIYK